MKFLRVPFIIVLFTISGSGLLMAQFTLSGEFRPRTEYTHGYKALPAQDQEPGFFTTQRSRINFGSQAENYAFYVCLQDVRTWGSQRQLVTNDGAFTTFHEAWGVAYLNERWNLKMGRQEINIDDQRIFGGVGWAQQARSHDAALLNYKNDSAGFKMQLGLAYNQPGPQFNTNRYGILGSYKTFQYLWLNKKWKNLNASLLALNLGQDAVKQASHKTLFNQTIGVRLGYKKGKSGLNLAFYQQMGFTGDTLETELSGQLASLDYSFQASKKLKLTAGYEYISGQSQVEDDAKYFETQRAFNPYFGTNHKFNGIMDYFYVGNHAGSVGLQDGFVKAKYTVEKWNAGLDVHYFMTANDVLDQKKFAEDQTLEAMDAALGTEIDASFGTSINKTIKVDFVYGHMLGTSTLEALRGGSIAATSNYAYVQLTIKPTFFKK